MTDRVDSLGSQFLPCSSFPDDQHICQDPRDFVDLLAKITNSLTPTDDTVQGHYQQVGVKTWILEDFLFQIHALAKAFPFGKPFAQQRVVSRNVQLC
jgi:hypothetical protein